jgi:micrococcal nuclease
VLRALALLAFVLVAAPAVGHTATLEATVLRVVDGDTVHVRVGERVEKVRYIGVNTPELHHPRKGEEPGGREAHTVNRRLVEGKRVRLELDVQSHDRHRRLLAYVWIGETMINAELVRLGYAQVMTIPPNVRHQALFVRLQREAREARRGLWRQAEQADEKGPSASLAPSAARSTYREYASRAAFGRRLASGSF